MVATREQVLRTVGDSVAELRALGVKRIGLFGSFARGEGRTDSDLDFLVELAKPSFDSYMDVKLLLEDRLGRPVDLVLERTIKPRLREPILRDVIDVAGF